MAMISFVDIITSSPTFYELMKFKKLPASVIDFRTLSSFKTALDQIDISALFSHV